MQLLTLHLYHKSEQEIQPHSPLWELTLLKHSMFAMTAEKLKYIYACLPVLQAEQFT